MPVWPFATTAATQYPLLLHYHPLMIYRHRVNKQADTLLAEMLFPEDQSLEQLHEITSTMNQLRRMIPLYHDRFSVFWRAD
jgi:hypothetical protein